MLYGNEHPVYYCTGCGLYATEIEAQILCCLGFSYAVLTTENIN